MPEVLSNFYNDSQKRSRDLSFNEISDVLEPFLVFFRNTYLVIDALDECIDEDSTHLKLLQGIPKLQQCTNLRVLATYRHIPDIQDEFVGVPVLEVRASDDDIERFAKECLIQKPRCIKKDEDMKKMVQESIAVASGGM
jgi:hypothetical protein